jgi:hypothetical protein
VVSSNLDRHSDCPWDPASERDVRLFMQLAGVAPEARDIVFSTAQALLQEWVDSSADEQPAEGKQ